MKDIIGLLKYLLSLSEADSFVEFKTNFDKERDGKNISALANIALLKGQEFGYIVYGIEDGTKNIIGTNFDPNNEKIGTQPLKMRLTQKLSPKIIFDFYYIEIEEKRVIVLEIESATSMPVKFDNESYIRIGESTTALKNHPLLEQKIWNNEKNKNFEKIKVIDGLSSEEVLNILDYDKYFQLTKQELPTETKLFVDKFIQEKFVIKENDSSFAITALGAMLFARNIDTIDTLKRKTIRVITYDGNTREKRKHEIEGKKGYASGFENLIEYIIQQVGNNEIITQSVRLDNKKYPPLALREFIANALIHQDFSITGTGPMIEIFDNKIEITNPGVPLIDTERFIDHPPRSRNEALSKSMRRFGFCEESGSGVDRALIHIELYQLPAPKFEKYDDFTKVTIFSSKPLNEMSEDDKIRACYQHCVLMYVKGEEKMQNSTLRQRLNIAESNYPAASKIIALTLRKGKIKQGDRPKEYIPRWA